MKIRMGDRVTLMNGVTRTVYKVQDGDGWAARTKRSVLEVSFGAGELVDGEWLGYAEYPVCEVAQVDRATIGCGCCRGGHFTVAEVRDCYWEAEAAHEQSLADYAAERRNERWFEERGAEHGEF